jgi:nitroreductase
MQQTPETTGPIADAAAKAAATSTVPRAVTGIAEGAAEACHDAPEIVEAIDAALESRRSIRAFLPDPVPRETIEAILRAASRAPSGTNVQPWHVHVVTGARRDALSQLLLAAYSDPEKSTKYVAEWAYYPTTWTSPYIDRRRKVGWDLYGLLEIGRADKDKMHAQHARNMVFFDAPVGLFFTIDRVMQTGGFLDYGMFLQAIMTAARARGLATCPQAAFMPFHKIIGAELGFPDNQMLVCGMALGWADESARVNRLRTERSQVSEFARFHDDEPGAAVPERQSGIEPHHGRAAE